MITKFKFCVWLVDTLSTQTLSLKEIQNKWINASANIEGSELTKRSFHRYKNTAELLFDIDIECDKSNGYLYKVISPTDEKNKSMQEWLLSAFRMSCLSEMVDNRNCIQLEQAPPSAELLLDIVNAINKQLTLKITYKSHYKEAKTVYLNPAFVRLFKQRWYVIGITDDSPRTYAFERMSKLETLENTSFSFTKEREEFLTPETYFEHCFGVIRLGEPLKITFRAFWPQDAYIRDVPIHKSQKLITKTADYSDFQIYIRPTYDLIQEFLCHRDKLAILAPSSFKEEVINVLEATLKGYKTGEFQGIL